MKDKVSHDPTVLPEIRRRLREAKAEGREVGVILLDIGYLRSFVMATKPSKLEQLENYFRGEADAPEVNLRKVPVAHLTIPSDDPVVLVDGRITIESKGDPDEAPIV